MGNFSCKHAVDYINKNEEGKLTLVQQWQLARHLFICVLCRRFLKQNKLIKSALQKEQPNIQAELTEPEQELIIQYVHENTKEI
jgi:hypothetical protein